MHKLLVSVLLIALPVFPSLPRLELPFLEIWLLMPMVPPFIFCEGAFVQKMVQLMVPAFIFCEGAFAKKMMQLIRVLFWLTAPGRWWPSTMYAAQDLGQGFLLFFFLLKATFKEGGFFPLIYDLKPLTFFLCMWCVRYFPERS